MHLIDIQFFIEVTTGSKGDDIHDLCSTYTKAKKRGTIPLNNYLVDGHRMQFYLHLPQASELQIISLAITGESGAIDSEHLLYAKINKDDLYKLKYFIHQSRWNARCKKLYAGITSCVHIWSEKMEAEDTIYIVGSVPITVSKISRENWSTVCCRAGYSVQAAKAFTRTMCRCYTEHGLYFIGSSSSVDPQHRLLLGHVHDISSLKQLGDANLCDYILIIDREYRSNPLKLELLPNWYSALSILYKMHQQDSREHGYVRKRQRKRIAMAFSQCGDDLRLKGNSAKSLQGVSTRAVSQIASMTFKPYCNSPNGSKISKTKHTLAA